MKNIITHIAAAVTLCAAAFASCLTASAQNLPEGTYEEVNGIAFRKSAKLVEGTNNQYIIDLEAFVTGTVTVTQDVQPSDISLVLDMSGSMNESVSAYDDNGDLVEDLLKEPKQNVITYYKVYNGYNSDYSGSYDGFEYFYKDDDGSYYKLKATYIYGKDSSGSTSVLRYFVYFTKPGSNNMYLIGQGGVSQPYPSLTTGATSTSNGIWRDGVKDYGTSGNQGSITYEAGRIFRNMSKLELLKVASIGFVETIFEKKPSSGPSHLVSIVTFAGSSQTNTVSDFVSISTNKDDLIEKINNLTTGSDTRTDLGVQRAVTLFDGLPTGNLNDNPSGRDDAPDFIVVFTDGEPGSGSFSSSVASDAIGNATDFKAAGGKVYTVGMIDNPSTNVSNFLNYLSSNYPSAVSMNNAGNPDQQGGYYYPAKGADLSGIFKAIAESASGAATNTQVTAQSAVTVDVVSTSFVAPTNVSEVTVLVAPCTGQSAQINPKTGKNYLTFDDPVDPSTLGWTITPSIEGDKVSTSGFDYSANFCWYNDQANPNHGGYKQIIRFKVTASDDAVGGPNVETNHESSGIYIDDPDNPGEKIQIAVFNKPTVKVPVQIWIAKDGLVGNDNAVFTLYWADPTGHYIPDPDNPDREIVDVSSISDWNQFTKVTLNNSIPLKYAYNGKQIPLVKIPGLDPDYVYRIKEDAWAWSYTPVEPIKYTVGENIENPFIFINNPKENLKEDEATIRNVFGPGTVAPDPHAQPSTTP